MYSAIFTIENHNPLVKFLNLIFGGAKKLFTCGYNSYLEVFLILKLMCSQNLYLCSLFLFSLQSEGLILSFPFP